MPPVLRSTMENTNLMVPETQPIKKRKTMLLKKEDAGSKKPMPEKDLGKRMFKLESIVVKDGFNIPLRNKIKQTHSSYLVKTATGYYKQGFMVLSNKELYLYHDKK